MAEQPPSQNPPPQQPAYTPRPQDLPKGLAVTSMILGILTLVFFCFPYLSIPCGGISIVLGVIARNKADRGEAAGRDMAQAGIIMSVIGLSLLAVGVVLFFAGCSMFNSAVQDFTVELQQAAEQAAEEAGRQQNAVTRPAEIDGAGPTSRGLPMMPGPWAAAASAHGPSDGGP